MVERLVKCFFDVGYGFCICDCVVLGVECFVEWMGEFFVLVGFVVLVIVGIGIGGGVGFYFDVWCGSIVMFKVLGVMSGDIVCIYLL